MLHFSEQTCEKIDEEAPLTRKCKPTSKVDSERLSSRTSFKLENEVLDTSKP